MHPMRVILGPSLVRVGMPDTVRTDSLRHAIIYAVVLGPVAHVVVAGVVDAAGSALT